MRRFIQARPSAQRGDALFPYSAAFGMSLSAISRLDVPLISELCSLVSDIVGVVVEVTKLIFVTTFCLGLSVFSADKPTAEGSLPLIGPRDDYVTSGACQECHADEHASWQRSFHSSMTQLATTNTMRGAFDGSSIEAEGLLYRVFHKGERYWAGSPHVLGGYGPQGAIG
jgi:hypothetical protein